MPVPYHRRGITIDPDDDHNLIDRDPVGGEHRPAHPEDERLNVLERWFNEDRKLTLSRRKPLDLVPATHPVSQRGSLLD